MSPSNSVPVRTLKESQKHFTGLQGNIQRKAGLNKQIYALNGTGIQTTQQTVSAFYAAGLAESHGHITSKAAILKELNNKNQDISKRTALL